MAHPWSSTKSLSPTPPWLPACGLDGGTRGTLTGIYRFYEIGLEMACLLSIKERCTDHRCLGISSARTFGLMEKFIDLQIIHHGKHHFIIQSSFAIYGPSPLPLPKYRKNENVVLRTNSSIVAGCS